MKRRAVGGTGGDHSGRHRLYEIEGFKEELVKSLSVNFEELVCKCKRCAEENHAGHRCFHKMSGESYWGVCIVDHPAHYRSCKQEVPRLTRPVE